MIKEVFRRTEIKYILSPAKKQALMDLIEPYLKQDKYFKGTNCSIYFDTHDRYLAMHSLEKPLFITDNNLNQPTELVDIES